MSENKVWFITGTSSGFGRSLAEEVIARGDRVIATARDPKSLDDLVARAPDRVHALRLDVTKPDQIRAAVSHATEKFGTVDVLVNNAGYSMIGALEETSEDELRNAITPWRRCSSARSPSHGHFYRACANANPEASCRSRASAD